MTAEPGENDELPEGVQMFTFGLGNGELLVVGLIALLLFGHRLPEVLRGLGRGVTEFMRGIQDLDDELRDQFGRRWRLREYEQYEAERPVSGLKRVVRIIVVIATILLVIGIVLYFFW